MKMKIFPVLFDSFEIKIVFISVVSSQLFCAKYGIIPKIEVNYGIQII